MADMNEARTAAGLAKFGEPSSDKQKLPPNPTLKETVNATNLWNEICTIITTVSLVIPAFGNLFRQSKSCR